MQKGVTVGVRSRTHTHTQVRHVQINMYDSIAVGFLLCMLMILYKFNNASAQWVRGGGGGRGGDLVGGSGTAKIGPVRLRRSSSARPHQRRREW